MPDLETAKTLLGAARRDLQALAHMLQPGPFPTEVFGFHVQQAVEKALKAWLCIVGRQYPTTHSIRLLIVNLEESGADVTDLWHFVDLSPFAVQFRYGAFEALEEPFDRNELLRQADALIARVAGLLEEPGVTQ
jgi:HEPN domain-containing protein